MTYFAVGRGFFKRHSIQGSRTQTAGTYDYSMSVRTYYACSNQTFFKCAMHVCPFFLSLLFHIASFYPRLILSPTFLLPSYPSFILTTSLSFILSTFLSFFFFYVLSHSSPFSFSQPFFFSSFCLSYPLFFFCLRLSNLK